MQVNFMGDKKQNEELTIAMVNAITSFQELNGIMINGSSIREVINVNAASRSIKDIQQHIDTIERLLTT